MQQVQTHQQFVTQQPGVTVITQAPPRQDRNKLQPSALSQMKGLSITQIVMGGLCLIFGIVIICLEGSDNVTHGFGNSAYGIWGGIYFVLVGGIGMGAVSSNTSCWIVSSMVLNIICSAVFFLPLIGMTAIGLGWAANNDDNYDCTYSYYWSYNCEYDGAARANMAMNSMILIMVIAELIITIWSSALCCGAICDCCLPSRTGHVIQYNNAPMVQTHHQQVMFPSVPGGSSYGVGVSVGGQMTTVQQSQYSPFPVGVHQQPVGMYPVQQQAPQGPPNYYAQDPNAAQQQGYQQPPPTAYPNNPQQPQK